MDFIPEEVELDRCLISKTNMGWLWHRRLAHVGMRNLHILQKDGHIRGLTNIVFEKHLAEHAKPENRLELIIMSRTSCLPQDHWKCYTWTCLVLMPTLA
jgi:hypothetical protein